MNISKASLPSSTITNIYYYFSYFTLFTTWSIFPILFYIILTQSKKLKEFKWFILNHSIWCLAFESFLGIVKPLYLCPAPSGFSLGILKDGNPYFTGFITIAGFCFVSNCVIGVFVTIINRYLFLFPSNFTKKMNKKFILIILGCILVAFYCFMIYSFGLTLLSEIDSTFQNAIEFDSFFLNFQISSLFFLPKKYAMKFFMFLTILLTAFLIFGFLIMAFFIILVKSQKSATTGKFQQSLIITSVIQILITCLFLLLPMILVGCCIIFQIPHSSGISCIFFCFLSFHSCLEYSTILYFVIPYRKYIYEQWKILDGNFRHIIVVSSAVSSNPNI